MENGRSKEIQDVRASFIRGLAMELREQARITARFFRRKGMGFEADFFDSCVESATDEFGLPSSGQSTPSDQKS